VAAGITAAASTAAVTAAAITRIFPPVGCAPARDDVARIHYAAAILSHRRWPSR
jgi:hypothetical protein